METANRLMESVEALQLTLHGQRLGILTHYTGGKNILTFDPEYKALREPNRPTMTLTQRMDIHYLDRVLVSSRRVPAVVSNLLPEGALRELLSEALKIQVANALYRYGAGGLGDIQQMARRLLANILLANGDAHLKNWTLIYPDAVNPKLAPAYDIVSTLPYVPGETGIALNLGKQKKWHSISLEAFQTWSERTGVPWPAVKVHLLDALAAARDLWPWMLQDLPMHELHKEVLRSHWSKLSADFKLL